MPSFDPNALTIPRYGGHFGVPHPFGGGGRGPQDAIGSLLAQLQQAQGQAQAANIRRYRDILGGYRMRLGQAMRTLSGLGMSEETEARRRWTMESNRAAQDLTQRGLAGTTILPTMRAGYLRQAESEVGRIKESVSERRLGLESGLRGEMLQFMERREDEGPDMGWWIQLLQALGQYGGRR